MMSHHGTIVVAETITLGELEKTKTNTFKGTVQRKVYCNAGETVSVFQNLYVSMKNSGSLLLSLIKLYVR